MSITLPLETAKLVEILKEKEQKTLNVCYEDSEIRGQAFLNYINNLGLDVKVADFEVLNDSDKLELVNAYFEHRGFSSIPLLDAEVAKILLDFKVKGFHHEGLKDQEHKLEELEKFFNNILYSFLMFIPGLDLQERVQEDEDIPTVDKQLGVESLITKLINLPGFLEEYIAIAPISSQSIFYKRAIEEPIFNGKNLFGILSDSKSSLFAFLGNICSGKLSGESCAEQIYGSLVKKG